MVEFELEEQGILVDQILWAKGVYLQPGRPGDRLAATSDNPRILVEVPANGAFAKRFRSLRKKALFRRFRNKGMSRIDSRERGKGAIEGIAERASTEYAVSLSGG